MLRPYRTRADEDARFGSTILSKSCTCFAKKDPKTLTSSIFHIYSASPNYLSPKTFNSVVGGGVGVLVKKRTLDCASSTIALVFVDLSDDFNHLGVSIIHSL
jgi:hypothetical protein